ncbi:MAG TPA: L,D-transpeptidase [Longimicrobium sp.]
MRASTLAAALALAAAPAVPARAQDAAPAPAPGLRLEINIPENRLRVFEGDSLLETYRVSVGMPGHDTPDGEFAIDHAEWNPWWRPPPRDWAKDDRVTPPGPHNPMGRVKLFFAPLYYIHGTPDAENIGRPASHGCVRMLNRDVVALAKLLHARHGGSLSEAEIARVLARPSEARASRLAAPVPLSIRYQPIVVEGGELKIFPDVYDRRRVHGEGVRQALLQAGYDGSSIGREEVRRVLERARAGKGVLSVPLAEAFAGLRRAPGAAAEALGTQAARPASLP